MGIFYFVYDSYALAILFISILLYFVLRKTNQTQLNLPPGPTGWPVLGYLPFVMGRPDKIVEKLSRQYGHIFSFPLGNQTVVVLNSLESIREAFVKQGDVFIAKPAGFKVLDFGMDYLGIFSEEGEQWKEQRTFAMNTLKEFGLGKLSMEDKILEECDGIVEEISKLNGKQFYVLPLFISVTVNVMFSVIFGERLQHDDPDFIKWTKLATDIDIAFSVIPAMDFFPIISALPHRLNGLHIHDKLKSDFGKFAMDKVKQQIESFDGMQPRGYVDCFLKEMYKRNARGEKDHVFDFARLKSNILAFIVAGSVSTGMTLAWAIRLLLLHPEVEKKVVQEIETVIGKGRRPSWLDRFNMPYTDATLHEVQRIGDVVPLGIPRSNAVVAKVMGFDIPKRSLVFANYKKLHNSAELWGDPENFRPDRYIDRKTGKCLKPEYLMPFGAGRRFCPGETLARMNMFLILVTVLQNFSIESVNNLLNSQESPDMHSSGMVRYLEPFDICAKKI